MFLKSKDIFPALKKTSIKFLITGSILFILIVALNSLLHAEGDTKTYRNVLILSFFINLILNPILIFGLLFFPALGVKGIAISTIFSQSVAFFIILTRIVVIFLKF